MEQARARQQAEIMVQRFAKADAGIDDQLVALDARP